MRLTQTDGKERRGTVTKKSGWISTIDFGSKYTKLVQGQCKDQRIKMEEYEIIPTPEDVFEDGMIVDPTKAVEFLKTIEKKIKGRDVRLLYTSSDIVLRIFEFPIMKEKELQEAVKFEMGVLLPEKTENYVIDYSPIEQVEKYDEAGKEYDQIRVQVIAVSKEAMHKYWNVFSSVGVKLSAIDVQPNVQIKFFTHPQRYIPLKKNEENLAIIDMGHRKTSVTMLEDRKIFLYRVIQKGSAEISNILSSVLDLNEEETEEWKKSNNLHFFTKEDQNIVEQQLTTEIIDSYEDFAREINQVIDFFNSMTKKKQVDKIFLTGGGSLLSQIAEQIEEYTGVKTVRVSELKKIAVKNMSGNPDVSLILDGFAAFLRRDS
ncbi:MAG TPA: hypothetical protein DHN33_03580 [Eubacteriaceae bacterium]|nr:hypothetical protein [Eubacteriaceae bacterium]